MNDGITKMVDGGCLKFSAFVLVGVLALTAFNGYNAKADEIKGRLISHGYTNVVVNSGGLDHLFTKTFSGQKDGVEYEGVALSSTMTLTMCDLADRKPRL